MADVAIPGMAVMYIWSTGGHVPATIIGPSSTGKDLIPLKYTQHRQSQDSDSNTGWLSLDKAMHARNPWYR